MWRLTYSPQAPSLPPFLFDRQRDKCEACRHCVIEVTKDRTRDEPVKVMKCKPANAGCSFARLPGQPCGPDALLFKESGK